MIARRCCSNRISFGSPFICKIWCQFLFNSGCGLGGLGLQFVVVLSLGLWACGGPSKSRPGAAASGVTAGAAGSEVAVEEGEPEPADEASKRFAALAKDLEDLASGKSPVDIDWLTKELKAVLKANSKHLAARFNLAVLLEKSGKKSEAREIYEDLVDEDPKFAPAAENLAAFYVEAGDVGKAEEIYARIVEADPKAATSRLALARIMQRKNKHPEAIELCRKVLQRKADAMEAFRILAESYLVLGDTSMAELVIGRGLKVDPDDVELHYLTAEILLARGELTPAVAKLKHVVRLKPSWVKARAHLGSICLDYNDFGNATQQFEAVLKERPGDRAAMIGLAIAYKGTGRADQAEKLYKELLTKNPKDADALWNLATLYWRHMQRYDEAVNLFNQFSQAADSKDDSASKVKGLVAQIQREKQDVAARKARDEAERKRKEAISAACVAVANNSPPKAEAIGGAPERIRAAWDLLGVSATTKLQEGDVAGAQDLARCAMAIVPNTTGEGTGACAQLRVYWVQVQDQAGLLTTAAALKSAKASMEEAVKCDPENPEAQLIVQQLGELILKVEAEGAAPQPPPPGGIPPT